jgi:bifunctional DNA-binding transcriptional regulator/antitoxin component of YhaV-PrlF toxin-antitoxin module
MGQRFLATITSEGKIALPTELLDSWGLKPGDQVAFEELRENASIMAPHRKRSLFDRLDEFKVTSPGQPLTQADIEDAISEEMEAQEQRSRGT